MSIQDFKSQFLPVADKSIASAVEASRIMFAVAEDFRVVYFSIVRESLGDAIRGTQSLLAAKTPQDLASAQSALVQIGTSQLMNAPKEFVDISMRAASDLRGLWNTQLSQFNCVATDLVQKTAILQQDLQPKNRR